ncbi:type II toxin-antitoxin system Phd/YefM family antitoxin [Brevibacterium casei]|uniref:Type II toxin-antitoxin system prevent-host-death family antitoxin n=1 Tax=Brevibacterium casei TaxID=33889 RepID=A0A7T4DKU8_9MICO|nr:type II toxin-antitoxin system prevent-host-death family antitoxin [Brevibacterium casei]QQB15169.1 type II toxin-antitoxin system prevent-host-death family antitoxin [Brevibacterium casei]
MDSVDIREAESTLSRLLDVVDGGETVIITRHGLPIACLTPFRSVSRQTRLGFLEGHGTVSDEFDDIESDRINTLFSDAEQ